MKSHSDHCTHDLTVQYTGIRVNVGTHKKTVESKNPVNRGFLVFSTKGEKIG